VARSGRAKFLGQDSKVQNFDIGMPCASAKFQVLCF